MKKKLHSTIGFSDEADESWMPYCLCYCCPFVGYKYNLKCDLFSKQALTPGKENPFKQMSQNITFVYLLKSEENLLEKESKCNSTS